MLVVCFLQCFNAILNSEGMFTLECQNRYNSDNKIIATFVNIGYNYISRELFVDNMLSFDKS